MTDIDISTWKFPSDVVLADRDFSKPAPFDILLGAEIFFEILITERYVCKCLPVLQNTKLGYILSENYTIRMLRITRGSVIPFLYRQISFIT